MPKPNFNIRDTIVCKGVSYLADAKESKYKYSWNTGENTQRLRIDNTGKYWVTANNKGCLYTDTFRVMLLRAHKYHFKTK
ncbi:MAG: hypothetical protein IPJ60_11985 [Sphingobacteriaceae bacterium]|nr:hypothetical protein [Sphingobacteriaceae bacterium]